LLNSSPYYRSLKFFYSDKVPAETDTGLKSYVIEGLAGLALRVQT